MIVCRDLLRDAAAPGERDGVVRVAELAHVVGPDADQRVVVDAVVLALELHDLRPAGVGPGDAHRVHRRLGAGHGHPRLADPRVELLDELHRADLVLAREREADAAAHPLVDEVVDAVVAVPEDHRAVAEAQVDVLVAVDVPDHAALAAVHVDRVLAPRAEVRIRAARQRLQRTPVHGELLAPVEGGRRSRRGFGRHDASRLRPRGPGRAAASDVGDDGRGSRGDPVHDPGQALRDMQQVRPIVPHGFEGRQHEYRPRSAPCACESRTNDGAGRPDPRTLRR